MLGKARASAELGHQVEVLFHPFKGDDLSLPAFEQESFEQKLFPYIAGNKGIVGKLKLAINRAVQFLQILKSTRQSDLLFLHKPLPFAMVLLLLSKIFAQKGQKRILILDDWEGIGGMSTLRQIDRPVGRIIVTICEEMMPYLCELTCSAAHIIMERFKGPKTLDKLYFLPLGAKALPASEIVTRPVSGKVRIGYVGTYKSPHLVEFLCQALPLALETLDIEFVLIGGGDLFPELQAKLGGQSGIQLTGPIPHAQVLESLKTFDLCMLFLSNRYPEAYLDASRSSTKMFEYFAAEKAVLASDAGEPPLLMRHGKEIIIYPNSPEGFVNTVREYVQQPELIARIAHAGRIRFEAEYSHQVLMKNLLKHLE